MARPRPPPAANALKFYASVRLDIRRIGAIKERDEVVGNTTRVKVVKNNLAPPFKQVEFDIMYGEGGVSKMGEILDLGVKAGIVEKSGAWFSYDSQRLGQGPENSKAFLKANPDMTAKIEAADSSELRLDRRADSRRRPRARRRRRGAGGGVRARPPFRIFRASSDWSGIAMLMPFSSRGLARFAKVPAGRALKWPVQLWRGRDFGRALSGIHEKRKT